MEMLANTLLWLVFLGHLTRKADVLTFDFLIEKPAKARDDSDDPEE